MKLIKFFFCAITFFLCLNAVTAGGHIDAQVLIVGGGPSGIHAAATLLEYNITDFIILEEDAQLGGYLETVDFGGFTFAPGSLWGYSPILQKLDDRNIAYHKTNYESLIARNGDGEDVTSEAYERLAVLNETHYRLDEISKDIAEGLRPDISLKASLAREGWLAATGMDKLFEWCFYDFFEGVSTRDISTVGPYNQRGLYTGDFFILDDVTLAGPLLGDQLALLNEDQVRYNQRAVSIDQTSEDTVNVVTEDGTEFTGEYVIVTSTIGVLQQGGVTFNPPLPPWKTEEICRFQMGTLDPIFLKFDTKFWEDAEWLLYVTDRRGYYPSFFNLEAEGLKPAGTNILISFLAGEEAYRAEHLTDEEVQAEVVEVLRRMYGAENVPDPTEFYMSRFATDPSLHGSLTTWPIGNIPEDAQQRLKGHVGRVYFAPEDASSEYIGIPFGSVRSGVEAAEKVVHCIEGVSCKEYYPMDPEVPPLCRDVKPYNPNKRRKNFNAVDTI